MFTKTTGLIIVPVWIVSIGWIVHHDILPGWSAQESPPLQVTEWLRDQGTRSEYAMFGDDGRLGTIWTTYRIDSASIHREDLIWIERFPLPASQLVLPVAPLRMRIDSVFTAGGTLDEFTARVQSSLADLRLHGERFHADFSFTFDTGSTVRTFKLPLQNGSILTDALNPFAQLSGIHVGQRWRMQVFNPLAALTGIGDRFTTMLVEVTGEDSIVVDGQVVDCLVVEAPGAKAWVDARGTVQIQETTLPMVGRLRIIRQSHFDEQKRRLIRNTAFHQLGQAQR